MSLPQIDISIEAGNWPHEDSLLQLVSAGVGAAARIANLKWPNEAELSVMFTDNMAMAEINGQWRNKPKPTNVLSFPGGDIAIGEPSEVMIGDLVFAFETVIEEAKDQAKTFEDHLTHLVVHGFLHLFGYDHLDDKQAEQMETLEQLALAELGIDDPYRDQVLVD